MPVTSTGFVIARISKDIVMPRWLHHRFQIHRCVFFLLFFNHARTNNINDNNDDYDDDDNSNNSKNNNNNNHKKNINKKNNYKRRSKIPRVYWYLRVYTVDAKIVILLYLSVRFIDEVLINCI